VFSSRGPTADGRQKPELAAPGFRILAARSTPKAGWRGERRLCVKSGTSMAAPWVSGTVALMYSAAARPLTIHEVRRILIGTADPHPHAGRPGLTSTQLGYGYLNIPKAVEAARRLGRSASVPVASVQSGAPLETTVEGESESIPFAENHAWAPTWVEDASAGEVADEAFEDSPAVAEHEAHTCSCGCGHCSSAQSSGTLAAEILESENDESEMDGPFQEIEEESAPYEWEDIREALETVDAER
jgi:hypothetical protein